MIKKIVKILLLMFWMGLIFFLSNQPYDFFVIKATNARQIFAHLFLYFVLAYLIVLAISSWDKWRLESILTFAVFFSIFYGVTDEYHQAFIPGRFVSALDAGFDAIGAIFGAYFYNYLNKRTKPKLLLHICCVGCGVYISEILRKEYSIILYFLNPNIFPSEEHDKRLEEAKKISRKYGLKLIIGDYNHNNWLGLVRGHEKESERGKRCLICYRYRLEESARKALELKADYFTTTLTISPHKDAKVIIGIGEEIGRRLNIKFLGKDFKKEDGFKKSCDLSKKLGLYRQDYCGCEFSRKFTN